MLTTRIAQPIDYPGVTEITNLIYPEPTDAARLLERDRQLAKDPSVTLRRLVALDQERVVGYSVTSHSNDTPDNRWYLFVAVHPSARGQGVGKLLLQEQEQFATLRGAKTLGSQVMGGDDASFAWAERQAYRMDRQRTESVLDLTSWDGSRFKGRLDRVQASGLHLVTMSVPPESLYRELYATDVETTKDHPEYDGTDQTYDAWLKNIGRDHRPRLWALAMDGDRVPGYSLLQLPQAPGEGGYTNYPCVRRAFRGRGVALAVKLLTIEHALGQGIQHLRTNNNPENGPMLAVNEKLGYRLIPGPRTLKKEV